MLAYIILTLGTALTLAAPAPSPRHGDKELTALRFRNGETTINIGGQSTNFTYITAPWDLRIYGNSNSNPKFESLVGSGYSPKKSSSARSSGKNYSVAHSITSHGYVYTEELFTDTISFPGAHLEDYPFYYSEYEDNILDLSPTSTLITRIGKKVRFNLTRPGGDVDVIFHDFSPLGSFFKWNTSTQISIDNVSLSYENKTSAPFSALLDFTQASIFSSESLKVLPIVSFEGSEQIPCNASSPLTLNIGDQHFDLPPPTFVDKSVNHSNSRFIEPGNCGVNVLSNRNPYGETFTTNYTIGNSILNHFIVIFDNDKGGVWIDPKRSF